MAQLQPASKDETAEAFLHWLQSLDGVILIVYSDGSLSSEGAASYGFTIHQNNLPALLENTGISLPFRIQTVFDGSVRLGPAEVIDAEATGTLEVAFLDFQAIAAAHGAIQVRWVPGHTNIPGKEQADKLAKAASSLPEPEGARPTLAYLRRVARQKPKEGFESWWATTAPEQYKRLNLKATTGCPPELSLPRAALHRLLAARSLHGDFAVYHERFDHGDAHLVCSCNRGKVRDHIFYCRKVPLRHGTRLAPSPNAAAVNLAIENDFTKFIELSKASAFFGKIWARY
ncbi:hypothetical protein BFJ63_vAg17048 [Fusarium oxysporum f. sp. narcissi]|uniref:Uncharacterized protein n=1 Tax=Fusarium oxysporum f. sp. narcissi TaxID=451672 RepID=A0A4Q2UZU5_FUSOX|nr:hypothetical protein BFJ63_vAg17048 [Fusarium oxysporum f. sp. narcissi]